MEEYRNNKNNSLAEQAYTTIKEAIVLNQLKPGDLLTEEKLAERLSISRTPIRSALQRLIYEGLAESQPNKTIVVSNVTKEDIDAISIVRYALEPLVIGLLPGKLTAEHLQTLRSICVQEELIIASTPPDCLKLVLLDHEFHTTLSKATGNVFLNDTIERIKLSSNRFLILSGTMNKYGPTGAREHALILEFLEKGQYAYAEVAMKEHILKIKDRILD